MQKLIISEKFAHLDACWRPHVMATVNDHEVKVVKGQGVFPWHVHADCDEMFLVWRGRFRVEFRDRVVELGPGEMVVVPCGVEHRTAANEQAEVLVFEPAGVRNTGNVEDPVFTAPSGLRV
jgi:mannose-6-phosphate isomerase-like protein (cupin superfamily)